MAIDVTELRNDLEDLLVVAEREHCVRDFWQFAKHCYTTDEADGQIKPFPLDWEYLHNPLHTTIEANQITQVRKVRQMMLGWFFACRTNWRMFKAMTTGQVYGAGIFSKGLDEAKELMRRTQFVYDHLPWFLQYPTVERNKTTLRLSTSIVTESFAATEDTGRTWTFSEVFLDEIAYMPWARQIWRSVSPTLGVNSKAILVSTPDDEFKLDYELWHQDNNIAKIFLTDDMRPDRSIEWQENERKSGKYLRAEDWARERKGEWVGFAGKPVYGLFETLVHCAHLFPITVERNAIIYRGWDLGYHQPVVIWAYQNKQGQLLVLREYDPADTEVEEVAAKAFELSEAWFPGCSWLDFPDPAGAQPNTVFRKSMDGRIRSQKSDLEVIKAVARERGHAFNPKLYYGDIMPGVQAVLSRLRIRGNGQPGIIFDDRYCPNTVKAVRGGYHYEERPGSEGIKEMPAKDGRWDHYADALRYLVRALDRDAATLTDAVPKPIARRGPAALPQLSRVYIEDSRR